MIELKNADIATFLFDLDGTLFDSKHRLDEEAVVAIRRLVATGHRAGIVTGRSHLTLPPLERRLGVNLPSVSSNGSLVAARDGSWAQPLYEALFKLEEVSQFAAKALATGVAFAAFGRKCILMSESMKKSPVFVAHVADRDSREPQDRWPIVFFDSLSGLFGEPIHKITFLTDAVAEVDAAIFVRWVESLEGFSIVRSLPGMWDAMPAGTSKGSGIALLAQNGLIDLAKTAFVGDEANDLPGFAIVKYSVAMQNAPVAVRERAVFVTPATNDAHGAARFIQQYLSVKGL